MEKQKHKFKTIDLVYIGLSAALISICAWITVPLTVPITLQTLGICLVAGLFGAKRGTLSAAVYILLGAIGVPVFSGFKGGIGTLFGATGGYIIGFIFTALIVGIVSDKTNKLWQLLLAMLGGVIICYAFGTAWFAFVYARDNSPQSLATILSWCVLPFLLPDIIKITIAAVLTKRLKRYIK
jgi:biotin transport system substrate-specific component